jgi:hypothetical protein
MNRKAKKHADQEEQQRRIADHNFHWREFLRAASISNWRIIRTIGMLGANR